MKFWEIFRFELSYQFRRPWTWLCIVVIIVLTVLMTHDKTAAEAMPEGYVVNSPFLIASTTVFGGLIWMMTAAIIAGDIGARDISSRSHPLFYTTSVSKFQYLFGRLSAALLINFLILFAPQIGILIGTYLTGVQPQILGPFRAEAYLTAFAYISLPLGFVATVLQFTLAIVSGRAMAAYLGSFVLFFMGFFVASFIFFGKQLGVFLDPIGIRFVVEDMARMWTTIEKQTRVIDLSGHVLTNRLIWIGVGMLTLSILWWKFRFRHRVAITLHLRNPFSTTPPRQGDFVPAPRQIFQGPPSIDISFNLRTQIRQTLQITFQSFLALAKSIPGLFLLICIPLITIPVVIDQMSSVGSQFIPTTARVISELTAPLSSELSRWVIIPALIIYFAGELIWRERDARIHELNDTMPGSDWAPLTGKFLGLAFVLVIFTLLQMSAAIVAQTLMNYHEHQVDLFIKILFGLQLPEYLLFAVVALAIHVIIGHKYFGHLAATMSYVFIAMPTLFGVEHSLLIFGASPNWSYDEIRGFGSSITPWLWFKMYWIAWATFLAVIAKAFWNRGSQEAMRVRIKTAKGRLAGVKYMAISAIVLIICIGGFIFYNTNIANPYVTIFERKERAAEYERKYSRFGNASQPELTAANINIDIYPETRSAHIRGTYQLVNRTSAPIDSIHVALTSGVHTEISFSQDASLINDDLELGHRIYRLSNPVMTGDTMAMIFDVRVMQNGFRMNGVDLSIAENGTSFTNQSFFPRIGYQETRELITAADRFDHALKARPLIGFLTDENAYHERGRGVSLDLIIGTSTDQTAVAPGILRRSWVDPESSSRRYFHYSTRTDDGSNFPLGNEWSFFSAKYKVKEVEWKPKDSTLHPVRIQIFHDPRHTRHIDRTVNSIITSLDYYGRHFGPYRYRYLTVVERPGLGSGAHADASMISHGEGFTHWNPGTDHDHAFAIMAHEIAHQWTVAYAPVEGAPVMSESIAWYYAMKAIENAKGKQALQRLFNFMWQPHPYAPIRRGEPLLRGVDPYMSYRKGPFALYTLSHYVGEEKVNHALQRLRQDHQSVYAPLATTLNLYRHLNAETPDTLKYLLRDLFQQNTYWKLKAKKATAHQINGMWTLSLTVESNKQLIDSAGVKHDLGMDEWIEIGVFGEVNESKRSEILYLQKHRVTSGEQTIQIPLTSRPRRAGIDPYHILDWEERSDANMIDVELN